MRASGRAAVAIIACLGTPFLVPPAAGAQAGPTITVTPQEDLVTGQTVIVTGSGFAPDRPLGVDECAGDFETERIECKGGVTLTTDAQGSFTSPYVVSKRVKGITCSGPPDVCIVLVAELPVPGRIFSADIFFAPDRQPDGQIIRRSDGVITGDDGYNTDGAGQRRVRAIAPGTRWSYALRAQNDGDLPADITVTAPGSSADFTVRYFYAWYDITASVTGGGFTFKNMAPGTQRTFGLQYTAAPAAPPGARHNALVTFRSGAGVGGAEVDAIELGVLIPTTSPT